MLKKKHVNMNIIFDIVRFEQIYIFKQKSYSTVKNNYLSLYKITF